MISLWTVWTRKFNCPWWRSDDSPFLNVFPQFLSCLRPIANTHCLPLMMIKQRSISNVYRRSTILLWCERVKLVIWSSFSSFINYGWMNNSIISDLILSDLDQIFVWSSLDPSVVRDTGTVRFNVCYFTFYHCQSTGVSQQTWKRNFVKVVYQEWMFIYWS